jgi:hypothetical protein
MSQNKIVTVPTFGSGAPSPDASNVAGSDDALGVEEGVEVADEVEKGGVGMAGGAGGPPVVAGSSRRCRRSACLYA